MTQKRHDHVVFSPPIGFKRVGGDAGWLIAYAAIFGNLDRIGERIAPGAFAQSIAAAPSIPFLWQHNQSAPIGRVIKMAEDGKGLLIEARLNLDVETGREAYALVKSGDIDSLSIGFRVVEREGNVLRQIELLEISLVSVPANAEAKVVAVKTLPSPPDRTRLAYKKHLRAFPLSRTLAEKVVDMTCHLVGLDEGDEKPACHFCNAARPECKTLLVWGESYICGDCAETAAAAAHMAEIDFDAVAKHIDKLTLEIKSLR